MKFQRYGIVMERLQAKHLEMVRTWRNSELVRPRMQHRELIDETAHQAWFAGINNEFNWYFVAYSDETPFGVFHIKNVNSTTKTGEAGAFVGDKRFIGDMQAASGILALMDFAFLELGLAALEAKYHPVFAEIRMLNEQLGYEMIAEEKDGFIRARVTKEQYLEKTARIRDAQSPISHIS